MATSDNDGATGHRVLWYSGFGVRTKTKLPEFDSWGIQHFSRWQSHKESGMSSGTESLTWWINHANHSGESRVGLSVC